MVDFYAIKVSNGLYLSFDRDGKTDGDIVKKEPLNLFSSNYILFESINLAKVYLGEILSGTMDWENNFKLSNEDILNLEIVEIQVGFTYSEYEIE